jgi:hypothetical protein
VQTEATSSSETWADFQRIPWRQIPDDRILEKGVKRSDGEIFVVKAKTCWRDYGKLCKLKWQ